MSSFATSFRQGLKDIAPVMVAYVPIGLLWGTLAAGKGFSALAAMLMSVFVYAGASQFVAVDMWVQPLPILVLTLTTLVVNLRHVLMSASISRHITAVPKGWRYALMFILTDESWAMAERRALHAPLDFGYMVGSSLPLWPTWFLCSFIGAAVGNRLGAPETYGLDFAFSAIFLSIIMGFWKGPRTGAVIIASGAAAVGTKLALSGAWYIMAGGVVGVIVASLLHSEADA
ncbi:MAG TPA: AzlC family ABC transporter permease [Aestuariivirga sp.]